MFSQTLNVCGCVLAVLLCLACSQDEMALLQHTVLMDEDVAIDADSFEQALAGRSVEEIAATAPRLSPAVTREALTGIAQAGERAAADHRSALLRGWVAFYERSRSFRNPKPQQLLQNAELALIETGAMEEMRYMAVSAAKASRSLWNVVPLDSVNLGYKTSFAPWNNLLQFLKLPLVKATFGLWVNFFGPYGDAARVCVSAFGTLDSQYGQHKTHEFSGINFWMGLANWENVPGWSFGSSIGSDDGSDDFPKQPDFGWSWTLAREPETSCFYFDVCVIDSEGLHANTPNATGAWLQMRSELGSKGSPVALVPEVRKRHGSTYLGHTWCSPNWVNTPLVLREDLKKLRANSSTSEASVPGVAQEAAAEQDVAGEAV